MKFLFVAKQKKNVDTFETTIAELLSNGHDVTLAIQQRDPERDRRLIDRFNSSRFALVACPEERGDAWRRAAPLVRSVRDWAQYFQAPYARASKLHQRALTRLLRELGSVATADVRTLSLASASGSRLRDALALIEGMIPSDPLHEEFIARYSPDVVLVSPGLHFGSGQSDFIKSARALGIRAWMLLFSWDNLSTKGALHVAPDRVFVWNARQVREAAELHGYPSEQVVVVGAPRFDEFFGLRSLVSREAFLAPLNLEASRKTILYLCSSRFIAAEETTFIRTWLATLRSSAAEELRGCNVIVRPHPDVSLEPQGLEPDIINWRALPQATGLAHRPFGDDRAVVLRTTYSTPQAFYECLYHADAVVALNTSAELEAGIVGRPVITVLATGEAADGQEHTLHFEYLLREHGGFVVYSPDLQAHTQDLIEALAADEHADIRAFVLQFLRPHGDQPVAPQLAAAIVEAAAHAQPVAMQAAGRISTPDAIPDIALTTSTADVAAKSLTLDDTSGLRVFATPETRRFRQRGVLRLDVAITRWLDDEVSPGDVFFDVGAGVGTYSLIAAVKRGALAVAFEPGFAVYRTLCENVRLNEATHGVLPLPVALTDRTGLFELEFSGTTGGESHVLRNREWRPRREALDSRQGHPVCAERLDEVVSRYGIPPPDVLRIAVRRDAQHVVAGAAALLTQAPLRSVVVTMARHGDMSEASAALTSAGFVRTDLGGSEDFGFSVRFDRSVSRTPTASAWRRLRETFGSRQRWRPAERRKNST